MVRANADPILAVRRASRSLAAAALVSALAVPALAQSVDELVSYRPDNRAGTAAAAATIAEMIAERSHSEAVRSRARSMAPEGSLTVGADELLIDIGAHAFVGAITGGGSVVPAAVTPPAEPVEVTPAPVIERVIAPPAPAAPPPVAATPTTTPAQTSTERPRRNWGVGEDSSAVRDLGGGGGGGGSSGGGGGGGGW